MRNLTIVLLGLLPVLSGCSNPIVDGVDNLRTGAAQHSVGCEGNDSESGSVPNHPNAYIRSIRNS